jgi:hypothetical protein
MSTGTFLQVGRKMVARVGDRLRGRVSGSNVMGGEGHRRVLGVRPAVDLTQGGPLVAVGHDHELPGLEI